jgi:hypothetical protein
MSPSALFEAPLDVELADGTAETQLPASGRSLSLRLSDRGEELEIRSPDGETEVCIEITKAGPVIKIRGAGRLELESTEKVAIKCEELEIEADKKVDIFSWDKLAITSRETRLRSSDDIWLNGGQVRIQCP